MSLFFIVLLPFVGAILPPLMIRAGRNACAIASFFVSSISLAFLLSHTGEVFSGSTIQQGVSWLPALGLNAHFFLDGLGFLFAGMILIIGLLIIAYARYYLSKNDSMGSFYSFLLLFQGAMLGIVLSDNILLLLVFWELTSLASFLLIGFWKHLPEGRQGARMALTVTGLGGLSLLAGALLLGQVVGSYDLSVILQSKDVIQNSPLYLPILLLILGGCFTKSAQFPFQFWLPHAMAAPTPVSAYLHSATMVKAGLFLVARIWPVFSGTDEWFYLVATTGLVTMLIGACVALFKDDLKGLLAYSTVSHLGLIMMLFGFSTPMAAIAAVFHIINHATFKAALFMNTGIVDHETGTRSIKKLGGLKALMPITTVMAIIASASMAGIPLFNGFLSKEMMLEEVSHTSWMGQAWIFPLIATLAAVFSAAYSFRYIGHVFLGPKKESYPSKPHDPSLFLWLPPILLTVFVVLIGILPEFFAGALVRTAAQATINSSLPNFHLSLWHGFTPALLMSAIAVIGGAIVYKTHSRLLSTWDSLSLPSGKQIFDQLISRLLKTSHAISDRLHDGSLQKYMSFIFITSIGIGASGFFSGNFEWGERQTLPASPIAIIGWLVLVSAALGVVMMHRHRFISLIILGVIGLMTSLSFILFSAPDLALTQVSVEVVTVILLLLSLSFLPQTTPKESSIPHKLRDTFIALGCGLGVTFITYAILTRDFSSLSQYYLENSVTKGGGANVVNVILVDFRGFDTFGEMTVLGIAGLAIFSLLDGLLRGRIAQRLSDKFASQSHSPDRHPMMMVVATRVMLPMALMVGTYIFLRGHNSPGGGFIAALVVSIALIMQYVASGQGWASKQMRIDYHFMIGLGIIFAAATGITAMLFGYPFLTSAFDHFHLPFIGEFELASAMGFDAGVFLTVVGAVMLTLANIARLSRHTKDLPINREPMDNSKTDGGNT